MHFGVWVAALASFRVVLGGMVLVNPPSDTTGQGAVSLNNVYSQQTVFTIQWDGATDGTISTIVLWQINLTAFNEAKGANKPTMGDLEYITRGVSSTITSFPWSVTTRKDLKVSNMFVMNIYKTGETAADDTSVLFNISSPTNPDSSPTPSAESTSITDTTPSTASTSASMPPSSSSSSEGTSQRGLDTATKAGIGVGIPAAVIAGITAGWLIFRKINNKAGRPSAPEPCREEYKDPATLPASNHETGGQERSSTGPHEMYVPHLSQNDR